jgi:hypothetical protein
LADFSASLGNLLRLSSALLRDFRIWFSEYSAKSGGDVTILQKGEEGAMKKQVLFLAVPLMILLVPAAAAAQNPQISASLAGLEQRRVLEEGKDIWIVFDYEGDGEYREMRADFVGFSDTGIVVLLDSLPAGRTDLSVERDDHRYRIDFPEDRVSEIRLTKHGISKVTAGIIGSLACGVASTFVVFAVCYDASCPDEAIVGGAVAGYAGGAVLGALLASPTPEQTVYQRGAAAASRFAWSLAPIVSRKAKGALFTFTW